MNLSSLLNYLIASFLVLNANPVSKTESEQQSLSNNTVTEEYCAAHKVMEEALLTNPDLQEKTNQLELAWEAQASNQSNEENLTPPSYLLPVVFHIIHNNGSENISDALVLQALQDLNDAYANTGYYDQGTGVDTEIQFCLAKRNPEGNPTTGINRVVSPLTSFTLETQDIAMKDLSRWDPTSYINIWLVGEICSASAGCGVAGYAYFPSSHGNPEDGIVLEAEYAGSSPANSAALAHEMGHYLGLYHTFQGGCTNTNCLADGDRVCDTPPDQSTVPVPCSIDINSCTTDVNPSDPNNPFATDQNDMFWNYMDYGDWDCYSAFTTGQDERMDFFIEGARVSLLDSDACIDACPNPIFISVTPCDTLIEIGANVTFVNTTIGATNFEWTVNNVLEATTTDFTYNFATEGTYNVLLTAFNGDTNCIVTKSLLVLATDCTGSTHVSDGAGSDVPTCGAPGTPCQTIQYALDNLICSGDTVFIHSGTYQLPAGQPNTVPIAKIPENYSVTFFGIEDNGPVLIDGNNAHRGFQYNYAGITCPDGNLNDGINISNAINFAHLTIQNVYLQAYTCTNTNQVVGGGIQILNSPGSDLSVSIRDCIFEDNFLEDPVSLNNNGRSVSGAAVYINGLVSPQNAATTSAIVVIDSCSFSNNRCHQLDNGGHGGAVYIGVCDSASITNSTFCNNNTFSVNSDVGDLDHDRNAGGALLFYDNYNQFPGHEYTISNCSFLGNEAMTQDGAAFPDQSEGGAVFLTRGDGLTTVTNATLTIGNSQFFDNKIETGTEHLDNNSGTIDLNTIGVNVFADELEFNLGADTTLCSGATLFAPVYLAGATYEWSTGETGPVIEVTSTGAYAVTITAGQCEYSDEILIVIENCSVDCENTYLETIGTVGQNESGSGMVPSGDGNFYISGHQGEDVMIIKMSPDGEEIWTRTMNLTSKIRERIYDMILDADGYLVACGNGGTSNSDYLGFVFKYDPNTNNLIWSNEIDGQIRAFKLVETSPTANYLVAGIRWNAPPPGQDDDAYLISIDRNTGDLSGDVNKAYYTSGTSESFVDMVAYNNALYGVGRYVPNSSFAGIRPSISKLDFSGNEIWSRLYMKSLNSSARLYNSSILIDQDSIVLTQNGDYNSGGSFTTDEIYFSKTDIDGNAVWTKSFQFQGLDEMYPNEAVAVDDGYLILAFNREAFDPRTFLIKTTKNGDLVWTKQITTSGGATLDGAAFHNQLVVDGDRIYIVGQNLGAGNVGDVLVVKLTLDGDLLSPCPFVEDASPIQTNLNAYDTNVGLSEYQSPLIVTTTDKFVDSTDLSVALNCIGVCEEACEDTYLQTMGTFGVDEGGSGIIRSGDGNFYLKGYQEDHVLLVKITPDGETIWSRTMKFTNLPQERIFDLILDSDGNLVGCGNSGISSNAFEGFAFKYDPENDIILWSHEVSTQLRILSILESSSTSSYHFLGGKWENPAPGNDQDAFVITLDRNTGVITNEANSSFTTAGSSDIFFDAVIKDGAIYTSGRFTPVATFGSFRPSITKLDLSGNLLWSRIYLQPLSTNARMYGNDLVIDQDSLVMASFGDYNGTNFSSDQIFLSKSDMDGNSAWTKAYQFPGYNEVLVNEVINLEDGYLLAAYNQETPNEIFILKTNQNGVALWAKRFTTPNGLTAEIFMTDNHILVENDRIYITGESTEASGTTGDILLVKADLNGDFLSTCPFAFDLVVNETSLPLYDNDIPLTEYTSPLTISNPTLILDTTNITVAQSCLGTCDEEICDNGIDDDNDGLVDFYDPDCPCSDSLTCGTPFYKVCAVECSVPPDSMDIISLQADWNNFSMSLFNQYVVGDVDGDCISDIVALREPNLDIVVLNSLDGSLKYEAPFASLGFFNNSHLAIGDVDLDGMMEIFVNQPGPTFGSSNLHRLDFDPGTNNLVSTWISATEIVSSNAFVPSRNLSPSLADFNEDGQVEVYLGNNIFSASDGSALMNDPLNSQGTYPVGFMTSVSVAVDVLADSECANCSGLELVAGNQVYSIDIDGLTMNIERELTSQVDGLVRIVDFDRDGDLDAVVSSMEEAFTAPLIYVWDLQTETLIGNPVTEVLLPNDPTGLRIGAVSIGDVDADGWPEITVATGFNFSILEDYQNGGGANWGIDPSTLKATVATTDESGVTGSTLYDFDGDGKVEIAYRDQTELRVFDENLTTIAQASCTSGTATEYPIVADIDSDGETELLCTCGGAGLQAFQSESSPWPMSRSVWNQYSYFAVNVNDNGSIPIEQQMHHIVGDSIVLNTFSQQQPIFDENGELIFPTIDIVLDLGPDTTVCDNGILELNAGSGFDTYEWNDGTTDSTYTAYGAGEYWVEITTPCGVQRDTIEITIDQPTIISLPDTVGLCGLPCTTLTLTDWYDSYEWFPADGLDCTSCSTVTACPDGPMTYTVLGSSLLGCFSIDSITIVPVEPMTSIVDTLICLGETVVIGNVEIEIGESDTLFIPGPFGCENSIIINVGWNGGEATITDVFGAACENEFFIYDGDPIPPGTSQDFVYQSYLGCDSTIHVEVSSLPTYNIDIPATICNGDSIVIFGEYQSQAGTYSMTFDSQNDCDSTINIVMDVLPAIAINTNVQNTCPGVSDGSITANASGGSGGGYSYEWSNGETSSTIMGLPAANYSVTVIDGNGCMEEIAATVNETDLQATTTSGDVTCNGSSDGFIEVVNPMSDWTFSLNGGTIQADPLFDNLPAGNYVLELIDGAGCSIVMNPVVNEPSVLAVVVGDDITITIGDDVQLQAQVNISAPYTITWSPTNNLSCPDGEPNLNCLNPLVTGLLDVTDYTVTIAAIGNSDCNASATIRITPFTDCDKVYDLPNAFTPDADGINDNFAVIAEGLREVISFEIYNRWGKKVYEGTGLDASWDGTISGKPAPSDVYLYMIRVECPDREERVLSGDVSLIR